MSDIGIGFAWYWYPLILWVMLPHLAALGALGGVLLGKGRPM